jgi:DNA-binding SARP family transcriptional activator
MAVVDVRLLGPMRVTVGGQEVDPGPVPQRKMLAALALDAGKVVPSDELALRLWDGHPPVAAVAALYGYAGRLQRSFAAAGTERVPLRTVEPARGYLLEVDPDRIDALRLQRYLAAAARRDGSADPYWADALDGQPELWSGAALAGLTGAWVARVRRQLSELRVRAAMVWADAMLGAGRAGTVIDPLRSLSAQHPLVEPLAAKLVQALCDAGKPSDALAQYTATRRMLADELGATPGLELRRLHRAIARGEAGRPGNRAVPATEGTEGTDHRGRSTRRS